MLAECHKNISKTDECAILSTQLCHTPTHVSWIALNQQLSQ